MYKIAVMGDRDSILGFGALGLSVFPTEDPAEARHTLHKLAREEYAIIYMTEQLASQIPGDIARYQHSVNPAIIMITGKSGSHGLATDALKSLMKLAPPAACILRGGKEAFRSNQAVVKVLREAWAEGGLPADCVQLVEDTSRQSAQELMALTEYLEELYAAQRRIDGRHEL